MKIFKDKLFFILISVLVIFTIVYFIIVNKVSYAFVVSNDNSYAYNSLINVIKECSLTYAKKNNVFKDENIVYIKVQDLIDNNLLVPTDGTNVISPLDHKTVMNSNLIKLKKDYNEIIVEVDS